MEKEKGELLQYQEWISIYQEIADLFSQIQPKTEEYAIENDETNKRQMKFFYELNEKCSEANLPSDLKLYENLKLEIRNYENWLEKYSNFKIHKSSYAEETCLKKDFAEEADIKYLEELVKEGENLLIDTEAEREELKSAILEYQTWETQNFQEIQQLNLREEFQETDLVKVSDFHQQIMKFNSRNIELFQMICALKWKIKVSLLINSKSQYEVIFTSSVYMNREELRIFMLYLKKRLRYQKLSKMIKSKAFFLIVIPRS